MGGDSPYGEPRPFFLQSFLKHEMVMARRRTILSVLCTRPHFPPAEAAPVPTVPLRTEEAAAHSPALRRWNRSRDHSQFGTQVLRVILSHCHTELPGNPYSSEAVLIHTGTPRRGAWMGQSLTQIVVPVLTDVQDTSDVINCWLGRATHVGLS